MWKRIFYSFPVQLLLLHFKKNQVLLLAWLLLFLVVTGRFGKLLGIPYLFLDPEYVNHVGFWSFFIVGVSLGGFMMAFHITCYILDGHRFPFLGTVTRPFAKFTINNSIIPFIFFFFYGYRIIHYQTTYEFADGGDIANMVLGYALGVLTMTAFLFTYFWFTNKDMFRMLASNVEDRIRKIKMTRVNAIKRVKDQKHESLKVSVYLDLRFRWLNANLKSTKQVSYIISRVFDQNHLNSVIVETLIFVTILVLGAFRDHPYFQIPAAASTLLFLTVILMITGALTYWLRGWSFTLVLLFFVVINFVSQFDFLSKKYEAYGLNYDGLKSAYSVPAIKNMLTDSIVQRDKRSTLEILRNWRNKFGEKPPKMVLVCTSGGGLRAALWTMTAMQTADSMSQGALFDHTMLITGASGGLIGASYYRELKRQAELKASMDPFAQQHLNEIGQDVLNPIIFSLLVNDVLFRYQFFDYGGITYPKDRGYAFERQLNSNTNGILDKHLQDYKIPEQKAQIPMLLLTPTSVNDGRKLYISPQHVAYMARLQDKYIGLPGNRGLGVDYLRMFQDQGGGKLSFLTALRMSATFPYITPNVEMPSNPPMELMDAGLADNFGVSDALRFLFVFRDWIAQNTSGVILLSIRDSKKEQKIEEQVNPTLFEKIVTPVNNVYNNWSKVQDIRNDKLIEYAQTWFQKPLYPLNLEYGAGELNGLENYLVGQNKLRNQSISRASLSWRLTGREKEGIRSSIYLPENQKTIQRLQQLLSE